MKKQEIDNYVCPESLQPLRFSAVPVLDEVFSGHLIAVNGHEYPIQAGVPDFTFPYILPEADAEAREMYDRTADVYDEYSPLTFATFYCDEARERNSMVDDLRLRPDYTVLEIGAGTGQDSELIAHRLSSLGKFYVQDISPRALAKNRERLKGVTVPVEFSLANGCYLPFPDGFFDAVFHFGGINTFSDKGRAFREIARVTKVGGRVVIGDESIPVWLRGTEFGKILMNSNPYYEYDPPFECLPIEARDVKVRWIIGGVFYVFDFTIGEGEPPADLDFTIPGVRGGSHRTRYYGQLEGVSAEVKELAQRAREKSGQSMHDWSNEVIQKAALEELNYA